METSSDRRKRKLAKLCDEHSIEVVASKASLNPVALEQILKGVLGEPRKDGSRIPRSLGNRAARAIEDGLNLGTGWFDAPDDPPKVGEEAMQLAIRYEKMNATEKQRLRLLMLAAQTGISPDIDVAPGRQGKKKGARGTSVWGELDDSEEAGDA